MKKLILSTLLILGFLPTAKCLDLNYWAGISCGIFGLSSIGFGATQIKDGLGFNTQLAEYKAYIQRTGWEAKDSVTQNLIQNRQSKYALGLGSILLGGTVLFMAKNLISSKTV